MPGFNAGIRPILKGLRPFPDYRAPITSVPAQWHGCALCALASTAILPIVMLILP
jgi:hypothetical protein